MSGFSAFNLCHFKDTGGLMVPAESGWFPVQEKGCKMKDPLKVLVVDDEEYSRDLIKETLEIDGHLVAMAENGTQGLKTFCEGNFDFVITDLAMPNMSGDVLAGHIKKDKSHVPVILITGLGPMMNDADSPPDDIDLVLTKPISPAELRNAVNRLRAD
ncbi:MAG: response regulator [Planctomycetota bacterium]|jgi:CheY-like chemotaxis protein|nr:response regulator [Planctomycetota bacterium]MDP6505023.1 response regulator [Planctomycetota bacterium]